MLDIWTPVVSAERQHQNFKTLRAQSHHTETLSVIQSWTEGFIDRDGKIVKEFQTTFNSSFWEIYLNAAFKDLGFEIDFSHSRPDFSLKKAGIYLTAEATIASHPEGAQPEWIREYPAQLTPQALNEIVQLATIRIANAIQSKHQKFCAEYSRLEHVKGKPFILCLAPFEQPFFFAQSDSAIRRVLYKFNAPLYIKDEKTNDIRIVGEEYIDNVVKDNNSEVELGFFTDDRMKEISAIIFSSTATVTKVQALRGDKYPNTIFFATRYNIEGWDNPHRVTGRGGEFKETLLDGLHIFLNPHASIKFNPSLLYHDDITFHYYDIEQKITVAMARDGVLISHGCMTCMAEEDEISQPENTAGRVFAKKVPEWEEATLYKLNARVGFGINNHIAHYKGWTVVVFQDIIDMDWAAIARPITAFEIQQFLLHKGEDIGIENFYESKEEAFLAIMDTINLMPPRSS